MSDPFTTPADASWQELLDEIVLAYSERRQVIGQDAYVAADDKDVQAASYWTTLQAWLETYCVSFIDHDNGPLVGAGDEFLYFTLDNWRAAAGLHANGFRRKYGPKEALVEAYGQMQAGDAIGPWIFEDLQKGFAALKDTLKDATFSGTKKTYAENGGIYFPGGSDLAHLIPLCEAGYAAASPVATTELQVFSRKFYFYTPPDWFDVTLTRCMGNVIASDIPTIVPHAYSLYLLAQKHLESVPVGGTGSEGEFNTMGDFTASDGVYSLVSSGAESSDASHSWAVGSTVQPSWCNTPPYKWVGAKGYDVTDKKYLLKWNFTNA
jgi:hypothetical protein